MALSFTGAVAGSLSGTTLAGNPHTGNYTPLAGSNRGLFIDIHYTAVSGTPTWTAATYDGVAMIPIGDVRGNSSPTPGVSRWYVLEANVGSGSKAISITTTTFDTTAYVITVAQSPDVDQATPIGVSNSVSGSLVTVSVPLTTASANNVNLTACGWRRGQAPVGAEDTETVLVQGQTGTGTGDVTYGTAYEAATGGADTIGMTASASNRACGLAFEVIEGAVVPPTGNPWYHYRQMRA